MGGIANARVHNHIVVLLLELLHIHRCQRHRAPVFRREGGSGSGGLFGLTICSIRSASMFTGRRILLLKGYAVGNADFRLLIRIVVGVDIDAVGLLVCFKGELGFFRAY